MRFKVGDIVDWDVDYINSTRSREYLQMRGPFTVIRCGPRRRKGEPLSYVVSLRRVNGTFEPKHNGTDGSGQPAPYGGNNWAEHFFKLDTFLTEVSRQRSHEPEP